MILNGGSVNVFAVNEVCHSGNAISVGGVVNVQVTATVTARKAVKVGVNAVASVAVLLAKVTNRFSEVSGFGAVAFAGTGSGARKMDKHLGAVAMATQSVALEAQAQQLQGLRVIDGLLGVRDSPVAWVSALSAEVVTTIGQVLAFPLSAVSAVSAGARGDGFAVTNHDARLRYWRRSRCFARVASDDPAKRRIIPVCGCGS